MCITFLCSLDSYDVVTEVAIASTGNWFIVTSDDGSATRYDTESGAMMQLYEDDKFNESLTSIALSPDDKWFLVTSRVIVSKMTKLFQKGDRPSTLRNSFDESGLDMESLISGGSNKLDKDDKFKGLILKWNVEDAKFIKHNLHCKDNHHKLITDVCLEPVAKRSDPVRWFATSSADHTVKIWHANSMEVLRTLKGHDKGVNTVALASTGKLLASGGVDNIIYLWDLSKFVETFSDEKMLQEKRTLTEIIDMGDISEHRRKMQTITPFESLIGHNNSILNIAIAHDYSYLISTSSDNTAMKFEMEPSLNSRKEMLEFKKIESKSRLPSPIKMVAVSEKDDWFISVNEQNQACIWDTKEGTLIYSRYLTVRSQNSSKKENEDRLEDTKIHTADIIYIVIQESENETVKFITSSYDNAIVKWEWEKSSEEEKIRPVTKIVDAHDDDILCVELASNNQYFVTTCYDTTIKKWDVNFTHNSEAILTFTDSDPVVNNIAHIAPVSRCCISRDSKFMISVR